MLIVRRKQLRQHRARAFARGMAKRRRAAHHLEGDPRESAGHPDANIAGIFALIAPFRRQNPEMVVAADQRVSGQEQRLAESAMAALCQRSGGVIDLIALVASGKQAGAAGDDSSVGVVFDWPGLS